MPAFTITARLAKEVHASYAKHNRLTSDDARFNGGILTKFYTKNYRFIQRPGDQVFTVSGRTTQVDIGILLEYLSSKYAKEVTA